MSKTTNVLQRVSVILAVTAASYGLSVQAQTVNANVNASASVGTKATSTVGQKIDKGIEATKNTTKKTVEFTKEAGKDAADATRRTGNKIAEKIPGTDANAKVKAEAAAGAAVKQ
ncbi:MAG: hypothetical protein LCH79_19280 [Proteobacteria bacterium]|jgi:hypothetical protein|nr:hypothetical protein [Pseudomonadota bacterium]